MNGLKVKTLNQINPLLLILMSPIVLTWGIIKLVAIGCWGVLALVNKAGDKFKTFG